MCILSVQIAGTVPLLYVVVYITLVTKSLFVNQSSCSPDRFGRH